MIGLDTNVLVRYIVRDDPKQASIASAYIRKCYADSVEVFISNIVLCELVWSISIGYEYKKADIISTIEKILDTEDFVFEDIDNVRFALSEYKKSKADFADALIGITNKLAGCKKTITFDKAASKLANFALID